LSFHGQGSWKIVLLGLNKPFKSMKTAVPQRLTVCKPALQVRHSGMIEVTDANAPHLFGGDETCPLQNAEMLGKSRQHHRMRFGKITNSLRSARETLHHSKPGCVAQGIKPRGKIVLHKEKL
ncbi:hypothetical protein VZ95_11495, partial [Elstera litoralis]